jgi:hypothetical protein
VRTPLVVPTICDGPVSIGPGVIRSAVTLSASVTATSTDRLAPRRHRNAFRIWLCWIRPDRSTRAVPIIGITSGIEVAARPEERATEPAVEVTAGLGQG